MNRCPGVPFVPEMCTPGHRSRLQPGGLVTSTAPPGGTAAPRSPPTWPEGELGRERAWGTQHTQPALGEAGNAVCVPPGASGEEWLCSNGGLRWVPRWLLATGKAKPPPILAS